ncbi:nucleotidyltransferase family protein [Telluribacter humicola]|uniref:nucleotidyltransferase family protein n=1 Tax=Telluribacter humicola TaxID=1720261 RepID=UPI001E48B387|nr:nucleotidyltransferase domain-containing protein [Telluribacter humicola]
MTIQELELILRREGIFEEFGINRLALFGSFARGEKYHDIDILLEQPLDYKVREQLRGRLQPLLHTKVDLVPAKFADPIILYRARKDLKYVTR